jgi:hypothetical protein
VLAKTWECALGSRPYFYFEGTPYSGGGYQKGHPRWCHFNNPPVHVDEPQLHAVLAFHHLG